jgi:ribosomal protein L11 methyltransferase
VVPAWEAAAGPSDRVLVIDPGPAFGTGTHETTRLCLRVLERQLAAPPRPRRALDIGTGSGILAVAAARRGVPFVAGVDSDPDAIASARHHARLNQVDLCLVQGDGGQAFAAGAFDLLLANLSAPLLIERRAEIGRLMSSQATLVLSGLLAADTPSVRQAYAALGEPQVHTDGEWVALALRRGGRL